MGAEGWARPSVELEPEGQPAGQPMDGDLVVAHLDGSADVFGVRQEPSREVQVKARRRHRAVAAVRAFAERHGPDIWAEDRKGSFQLIEGYRAARMRAEAVSRST